MPSLLVISDLHMGAGPLDDFEPEIERHLVAFLEEWRAADDGVELVINGDLLDFVQAPPYKGQYKGQALREKSEDNVPLCFTEEQSCAKLDAIYGEHKASFHALGDFLAHRLENRIVILPGNHDADFYWPTVQEKFRGFVCGANAEVGTRLIFWLDSVYRSEICPKVWIEHGHQYEEVNSFFIDRKACWSKQNPPIRKDRKGVQRLYECIGTRFMILYLNDLDRTYPYVDNIKPFWRFLQLFGLSAFHSALGSLQAAVAVAAINAYLARTLVTRPGDVLFIDMTKPQSAVTTLREAFKKATPSRQKKFVDAIRERGYPLANPTIVLASEASAAPLMEFLAENLDLLEQIDRGPSESTLALGRSFVSNETDELKKRAAEVVARSANAAEVVVMGHTHEVVDVPGYVNTGSWTRYYKIVKSDKLPSWRILREKSWNEFPYQLNYALARPNERPAAVLRTYK